MRTQILTLIALFCAPLLASAQGATYKTERGNIYSAGGSMSIAEDASNDIVAAGGNVSISGNAGNGLLAAAGSLVLSGTTGGDARVAGGSITLAGTIGGEAVLAGGNIHILPESLIKSALFAAAGDLTLEGNVQGGARIIAGTVTINGTIDKDVDIKAEQLIIGKTAKINGNLHYEAPEEAQIDQAAVITGEKTFQKAEFKPPREKAMKFLGAWWIIKLLAVMTAAVVIFLLLPERTTGIAASGVNRFGHALLVGFLVLVAVPALILLLFITVLGSLLALVTLFLYTGFLMLSSVFGALIFIRWVMSYGLRKEVALTWPLILLGVLIYQVLGLIPFLGWIFKFVFFLTALGSLSHAAYSLKERRTPPPGAQTTF